MASSTPVQIGASNQTQMHPPQFLQRFSPIDELIRKRALSSMHQQHTPKRSRCEDPCNIVPGDLWRTLKQEAQRRQTLFRLGLPTPQFRRQLEVDEKRLGLQLKAMVCEDLLSALQYPGLSKLDAPSEKLLVLFAKAYRNQGEHPSEESLLTLFHLDTSLFADANATLKAYLIKYLSHRKDSGLYNGITRTWKNELATTLSPECIDKFIQILTTLSGSSQLNPHHELWAHLEWLKTTLLAYKNDERNITACPTQVIETLAEITYILKNSQLTAAILLATLHPENEDHYLSILDNEILFPTDYHFIEALHFNASLRVCQRLQDHSSKIGAEVGITTELGFQDYQLCYALQLNTPLPIIRLIPLNPHIPFYYLEEAIKAKCSSEVITYLIDEAKRLTPEENSSAMFESFQLALEHDAPIDVIQRFIHNECVQPNHNSFFYAFKRSPLTRDILVLLWNTSKDIPWHELVNYLNRAINDHLSPDVIIFLLDRVIHTSPSKIREENQKTRARELAHCFDQAMMKSAPFQVIQAFIQEGRVEPQAHHIFSGLNWDTPDQHVITLLCQSMNPENITPDLRNKAHERGISLPQSENASQDPFVEVL